MIDISKEELLTLAQAARRLPSRGEKGMSPSTVWRWATNGLRGHRLEVIHVGGKRCTSVEALQRFFESIEEGPRVEAPVSTRSRREIDAELTRRLGV